MKAIAFYNNKGGVGKTTSAINVGYELSFTSSVLIIDMDGQGNCSRFFADKPKDGDGLAMALTDIAVSASSSARCVTRYENIDIITSTAALNKAAVEFQALDEDTQDKIAKKIIRETEMPWFSKKYDFVLVDLPPSLSKMTEKIISVCDYVFVPIELGTFAIQGIPAVTKVIASQNTKFGGCFVNKYDRENPADVGLLEMLKSSLGDKALKNYIPFSRVVKNSISYRMTAHEYMGWTYAAECCANLAKEIVERCGE